MAYALRDGDVFADRFQIVGMAGRGGMGAVYRAKEIGSGKAVALKVLLHQNLNNSAADLRRFERETKLVAQLDHPNVVKMLKAGANDEGQGYIAFEFLEGKSLSAVLRSIGAFTPHEAWRIGCEVLAGLQAAHQLGIVHRDIKPGNIHLCGDGLTAKVLDFGIAKALISDSNATQVTEAGEMVGTPQYMAPEQVKGLDVVPATDLYSLGLVLAELLTGVRVIVDKTLVNVYMKQMSPDPLPLAPAASEGPFGAVIRKATQKIPKERFQTAAEMRKALVAAEPDRDAPAVVPPPRGSSSSAVSSRSSKVAESSRQPPVEAGEPGTVVMTDAQLAVLSHDHADGGAGDDDADEAPTQLMTQDALVLLAKHDASPDSQAPLSAAPYSVPQGTPSHSTGPPGHSTGPPGHSTGPSGILPTLTDEDLRVLRPDRTWFYVFAAVVAAALIIALIVGAVR